ncbi:MAG: DNA methylase, partial [Muribaculaceae bacterium]|nr:DNA methylase [Muribaculaceae bacterium]
ARMARNVALEMADNAALKLLDKRLLTDQITLTIGYDVESLANPEIRKNYHGKITSDFYGRSVPAHAHGTVNIDPPTSSGRIMTEKVAQLFDRITNPDLLVRRLTLSFNRLVSEDSRKKKQYVVQPDLFTDMEVFKRQLESQQAAAEKERRQQETVLRIKKMFGKNAILKGLNYAEGATQRERNKQIGGHHE